MELLLKEEIRNKEELEEVLEKKKIDISDYKIGVIAALKDKNNQFLLQRRGSKCRDEKFKLEYISGKVEEDDISFIDSIKREILEEAGNNIEVKINKYLGCFKETKFDTRLEKEVNWLFIVYEGIYLKGALEVKEKDKCLGYELYNYENLPINELSESCLVLTNLIYQDK